MSFRFSITLVFSITVFSLSVYHCQLLECLMKYKQEVWKVSLWSYVPCGNVLLVMKTRGLENRADYMSRADKKIYIFHPLSYEEEGTDFNITEATLLFVEQTSLS